MGKHGKNTTGKAAKLKAKARAKRKLLKKAKARVPARPQKPAATAPEAPPMDVDAFLAGDHLAAPADAPDDASSASSSASSASAAADHRAELDALRASDPEFYDYLRENDEGLLAYEDPADDDDDDAGEEAAAAARRVVSVEDVAALAADGATSFRATKRLVALLRAACGGDAAPPASRRARRRRAQPTDDDDADSADSVASAPASSDDDDDDGFEGPAVDFADAAAREACARHALAALGPRLRALAGGADAARAPDRVRALARSVLVGLLKALKGDDAERATRLRVVALEAVAPWAPWLVVDANLAPRTCRALCGLLCRVVEPAPEEADDERVAMVARETRLQRDAIEALRAVLAHTRDIRVDARGDETVEAHALRRCYAAFARDVAGRGASAQKARKAFASVALVQDALVGLYADAGADAAYRTAFVAVRQLALKVRSALATRAPDDVAQVLSWKFLHCARLWARCVCGNAAPERLGELAFPLCQTLFGALELAAAPSKAPFRLHCVRCLHDVAAATECFVPTTKPLLATLDECSRGGGGGGDGRGGVDDGGDFGGELDCGDKRDASARASLGREALEQLLDFLELHRYAPALPELALVPLVALKKLAKEPRCPQKLRARAKAAAATLESAADAAAAGRARLAAAPKDVVAFEPLKPPGAPAAARRLADRRAARAARAARLKAAPAAAPEPKPKKPSKKKARAPEPAKAPKPKKAKKKASKADKDFAMDFDG